MCTVTIIPLEGAGYRLKVNRDELRTRPEASPPVWREVHPSGMSGPSRRAIYPVDPKGGGTWVAAAPGGLAMAILNLNLTPAPPVPADLISRGAIIPGLVGHARADDVIAGLERMDLERYKPFRLVVMDLMRVGGSQDGPEAGQVRPVEAAWDRQSLTVTERAGKAACWASSGLGDAIVQVRLPMWEEMLAASGGAGAAETQERFHTHRWPERTHQSVLMSRPDARTVSITTVEVRADAAGSGADVRMWYEPVREAEPLSVVRDRGRSGSRAG
jgi:hypothetical protein